tara:strand:+ start:213 stop:761 length:549 start_codon:yes stop_codon:yes gene_type:complete
MNILNWYFTITTVLVAIIVAISFWSRKGLKLKVLSLTIGSFSFILIYGSLIEVLSRAKPKNLELLNKYVDEVTLLHVNWIEGEAIYLLVQLDNSLEPRLYKFPWSAAQAQEFDEAISEGRENGQEVRISNPFYPSNSEERKTLIYAAPASPLPAKEPPEVGITAYDPEAEKKSLEVRDQRVK